MRRAFTLVELMVVVAIIALVASILLGRGCGCGGEGGGISAAWSESTAIIKVSDKYTTDGTRYVDAEDETFQVLDSALFDGHWNAADVYRDLKKGGIYSVQCRGFRDGKWSQFRNIIEIVEVIKPPEE